MTTTTANNPKRLVPGVHHFYGMDYDYLPKVYDKFTSLIVSNRAFEEIVSMAGVSVASVKNESAALAQDDITQGFPQRLTSVAYGKMLIMTREARDDDQYSPNVSELVGKSLARSMNSAEEIVVHSLLNEGFSTVAGTYANMYQNPDAVALFSTAHLLERGGTFSNKLAVAADLSEASIEQLVIQSRGFVDGAGHRLNVMPKKLIVSTSDEWNARRLLESLQRIGTADNDINTINRMGLELVVSPYLTDTDAWFLTTDLNQGRNGLMFMRRAEPRIDADTDFDTKNLKFSIDSRMGIGYADARCILGSEGA